MANQTPLKAKFTGQDVTSLGEFESTDTINPVNLPAASESTKGALVISTEAEVNSGQDDLKAITPQALSQSNYGRVSYGTFLNAGTALTTGDGKSHFRIREEENGFNLVAVRLHCLVPSSSGVVTVQLRNITKGQDMLSTRVTIDQGEYDSKDSATPYVIDLTKDDVSAGDFIAFDVDVAGTGVTWLYAEAVFSKPLA